MNVGEARVSAIARRPRLPSRAHGKSWWPLIATDFGEGAKSPRSTENQARLLAPTIHRRLARGAPIDRHIFERPNGNVL
jgi:hypothetical protein